MITRPGLADEIDALAGSLQSYEARRRYVLDRLIPFREERSYGMDRALIAGGRMFGVGKRKMRAWVKTNANMVKCPRLYSGPFWEESRKDRESRIIGAVPSVREFCGYVYRARLTHYPHIFKIGFTTNPDRRLKELNYLAKTEVEMEDIEVGTYFEEAYRLLRFGRLQIREEWFFDPSLPVNSMPNFLGSGASLEQWQRAAARNYHRGPGQDPIGATAEIYLEILQSAEAA